MVYRWKVNIIEAFDLLEDRKEPRVSTRRFYTVRILHLQSMQLPVASAQEVEEELM